MGSRGPDLEEATVFFIDVIGCEPVYSLGPFRSVPGTAGWPTTSAWILGPSWRAAVLPLRRRPNFEILEYEAPGQRPGPPRNSDVGGHHLADHVRDLV